MGAHRFEGKTLAVMLGGTAAERSISLESGENIARALEQAGAVLASVLKYLQEPRALVQLVAFEAHQQVVGLSVIFGDQSQGLLGGGAELARDPEGPPQLGE